ncbi:MAG: hypothetical protein AAF992_21105 [Bacteroidota bacterium]
MVLTLGTGCEDDPENPNPAASSDAIVIVPAFIRDKDGNPVTEPETLIHESSNLEPVIAPDGHHVTFEEFSRVKGSVSAECTERGTEMTMKLTGLIPNGVYTLWNLTFLDKTFDPTVEGFNIVGVGAAGPANGSQSIFVASAEGEGQISLVTPGGDLSMKGSIQHCALDEMEWHIIGAYHIDGQTYGPSKGPKGTVVEQFGFIFKN